MTLDTYAFCLLGNHFHFLVQVKDLSVFRTENNIPASRNTHDLVCMQWRKLFQSYAMAFNKQHNRTGTLFQTPFKRALIDEPAYLNRVVEYIHTNPQRHRLIEDFRNWEWSSYRGIISEKPSKLKRHEVVSWFGNAEKYINSHSDFKMALPHEVTISEDDN